MSKLRICSPIGQVQVNDGALATRSRDLRGLRLGVLNNGKPNSDVVLEKAANFLAERLGLIRTTTRRKANNSGPPDFMDEFADQCDVALVGVGD